MLEPPSLTMHRTFFRHKANDFRPWKAASAVGMSLLLFAGQTAPLIGNPTGGAVVAGSATVGAAGPTLTINQSTQSAIINWQTFNIAGGETTKFIVPNSGAATLNRVAAGNPSADLRQPPIQRHSLSGQPERHRGRTEWTHRHGGIHGLDARCFQPAISQSR